MMIDLQYFIRHQLKWTANVNHIVVVFVLSIDVVVFGHRLVHHLLGKMNSMMTKMGTKEATMMMTMKSLKVMKMAGLDVASKKDNSALVTDNAASNIPVLNVVTDAE